MSNSVVYCGRCGTADTLRAAAARNFHTNRSACCNEVLCLRKPEEPRQPLQDFATGQQFISIHQAGQRGIERLRKPIWSNPLDHLKIDIVRGGVGPWLHLYAPFNKECNGRDPVNMLGIFAGSYDSEEFVPYAGPLPESAEYKADVAKYDGALQASGASPTVGESPC